LSKLKIVGGVILVLVTAIVTIGILSGDEPDITDDIEDNPGQPEPPGTEPDPESEPEPEEPTLPIVHIDIITACSRIIDGDTFETSDGHTIRLADINTPETNKTGFQESTDALSDLIYNKTVYLEVDEVFLYDYNGTGNRYVCVVYLVDGLNINQKLLTDGFAVLYHFVNEFDPSGWSLNNNLDISNAGDFEEIFPKLEPVPTLDPEQEQDIQEYVIINEVEANPAGDDAGNEWVELYNPSNTAVDISGWQVSSTKGQTANITISQGTILQAGKYKIITYSSQWIDNEDEQMILYDSSDHEIDRTKVFFDITNDDRTIQRYPNGGDTDSNSDWSFRSGTQGESN